MIESTITRLSQFLANEWLVRILYQPVSTVNFDQIINNQAGQLTIFSLPIGRLGEEPAALLGSLLLGRLATTIFGRIDYGAQLPRLHIYIDELSRFSLPITARLWTEGGKYNIGLTATLQTLSQLQDEENKSAVLQAGNHICFQLIGPGDAQVMASQMPIPDPAALMRPEPMLAYSRNAIEEIIDKGHPNPIVMEARVKQFWVFEQLQDRDKTWIRYPFFTSLDTAGNWDGDREIQQRYLECWRSHREMIEDARNRLNAWFYQWMKHEVNLSNLDIDPLLSTVFLIKGALGIRMEYRLDERQDWREYLEQKSLNPRAVISPKELEQLQQWRYVGFMDGEEEVLHAAMMDAARHPGQEWDNYPQKVQEFYQRAIYESYMRPLDYPEIWGVGVLAPVSESSWINRKRDSKDSQRAEAIAQWETENLYHAISNLLFCAIILQKEPMHIPSRTYKDVEYSRRTYADVRDELTTKLISLPRYEAIVALVSEKEVHRIKTLELPSLSPSAQTGAAQIKQRSHQQVNRPMREIMDSIKKRNKPIPGNLPPAKDRI